jgi:hypothetical protein
LNRIMQLQLPEVDRDTYRTSLGVSAGDYSLRQAREFRKETYLKLSCERVNSCDSSNEQSGLKSSGETQPQTQTTHSSDYPPEKEPDDDVDLIDDALNGISLQSFNITGFLGKGTFGKVLKVHLKSDPSQDYALKVLSKAFLLKNHHLKYAVSECNILKRCSNPFVLKMHYSF